MHLKNPASMSPAVVLRLAIDLVQGGVDGGAGCCHRMRLQRAPAAVCRGVFDRQGWSESGARMVLMLR
jgi:hypothetical protein